MVTVWVEPTPSVQLIPKVLELCGAGVVQAKLVALYKDVTVTAELVADAVFKLFAASRATLAGTVIATVPAEHELNVNV